MKSRKKKIVKKYEAPSHSRTRQTDRQTADQPGPREGWRAAAGDGEGRWLPCDVGGQTAKDKYDGHNSFTGRRWTAGRAQVTDAGTHACAVGLRGSGAEYKSEVGLRLAGESCASPT